MYSLYRKLLSITQRDLTFHTKINTTGHTERVLSTALRCVMSFPAVAALRIKKKKMQTNKASADVRFARRLKSHCVSAAIFVCLCTTEVYERSAFVCVCVCVCVHVGLQAGGHVHAMY